MWLTVFLTIRLVMIQVTLHLFDTDINIFFSDIFILLCEK